MLQGYILQLFSQPSSLPGENIFAIDEVIMQRYFADAGLNGTDFELNNARMKHYM